MSQLSVDSITGRVSGSAPSFPNGAVVTGVVTATSFSGAVTGNVTGNATGLSGSPSITVTNVSAQDVQVGGALTVTGNLTVNGTTTTIDTVVTAVDSLTVDGDVNVGAALSAADYQGNFILDMYLFS